jgi:hypothetical protein
MSIAFSTALFAGSLAHADSEYRCGADADCSTRTYIDGQSEQSCLRDLRIEMVARDRARIAVSTAPGPEQPAATRFYIAEVEPAHLGRLDRSQQRSFSMAVEVDERWDLDSAEAAHHVRLTLDADGRARLFNGFDFALHCTALD